MHGILTYFLKGCFNYVSPLVVGFYFVVYYKIILIMRPLHVQAICAECLHKHFDSIGSCCVLAQTAYVKSKTVFEQAANACAV